MSGYTTDVCIELSPEDASIGRLHLLSQGEAPEGHVTAWMPRADAQLIFDMLCRQERQARCRLTAISTLRHLQRQIEEILSEFA
jgi:hypothetical protein